MISFAYESDSQLSERLAEYMQGKAIEVLREIEYIEAELDRRGITKDNIKEKFPEYFI
jgi:predicted house-cleaning noncanonical NTP pyrophosphatase (MazG superfamily)